MSQKRRAATTQGKDRATGRDTKATAELRRRPSARQRAAPAATPGARGFRISMRPEEAVLWLSLLEYCWRGHLKLSPKGRSLEDSELPEGLKAIGDLFSALGLRRDDRGRPDVEAWADRQVGENVRPDAPEILPAWLRASSGFRIEATADVPYDTWDAVLTETARVADREQSNNEVLWQFVTIRNCDLGDYDGHQVLWEDLLGGILRALREASTTNLVAFETWALGREPHRFPLWREIALLAWTRALVYDP